MTFLHTLYINPFFIGLDLCQYERTMRDQNHLLWCIIYYEIIIARGGFKKAASSLELLYDKVNRTCITFNVSFLNAYIMIPSHTGSALSTHTTLFGWVILITMMSLDPRLRSCL